MKKDRQARILELSQALKAMDEPSRDRLIANVAREDPSLALELSKLFFKFEDLLQIEEPFLQRLFSQVQDTPLALALKTASDELKAKILKCLPARRAQSLQETLQSLGKRRLSEVQEAQTQLIELARSLGILEPQK